MEYVSVQQARGAGGLRLVVTAGIPGPWSESAKKIFEYKRVPYQPVAQYLNQANTELLSWVGVRNAPVAVYEAENPQTSWSDILLLAERLAPDPALLPRDPKERAAALALCNEICGEWGFGWCRRLLLMEMMRELGPVDDLTVRLHEEYGFGSANASIAPQRAAAVLRQLAQRLRQQHDRGNAFFSSHEPGACDIYWACFSLMIRPLAPQLAPLPQEVRRFYSAPHPAIEAALDPILIEHRDLLFARFLRTPLDF